MRAIVLFAASAAALLLSAPAGAKELVKAELCGPAGCAAVYQDELRLVPIEGLEFMAPPPMGAYYELVLTARGGPGATGKPVAGDPATYAQLFTAVPAGPVRALRGDWVRVELRSAERTPWTTGAAVSYSPSAGVLRRGPDLVRLADGLADELANARALGTGGDGTALLPWLALAALGAWFRRRRDAPAAGVKPTVA
jgi:uncharacterized protein (TIGR03382 family)